MNIVRRRFLGLASMLGIGGLAGGMALAKDAIGNDAPLIAHQDVASTKNGSTLLIVAGASGSGVMTTAKALATFPDVYFVSQEDTFGYGTVAKALDAYAGSRWYIAAEEYSVLVIDLSPEELQRQADDVLRAQTEFRNIVVTSQVCSGSGESLSVVLSRSPIIRQLAERAHFVTFASPVKRFGRVA